MKNTHVSIVIQVIALIFILGPTSRLFDNSWSMLTFQIGVGLMSGMFLGIFLKILDCVQTLVKQNEQALSRKDETERQGD